MEHAIQDVLKVITALQSTLRIQGKAVPIDDGDGNEDASNEMRQSLCLMKYRWFSVL